MGLTYKVKESWGWPTSSGAGDLNLEFKVSIIAWNFAGSEGEKDMKMMTDESNLLKLVSELGSKIETAKGKILAGEEEGQKYKSALLESKILTGCSFVSKEQQLLCIKAHFIHR